MNILIIGNGGREHALAWKARQSEQVETVYVAPGNAGTDQEPGIENVPVDVLDLEGLAQFAAEKSIGLTIVGPEAPLVAGVVDLFEQKGLPIFGPSRAAAQLEGSKAFTKDFLHRHSIPTAWYQVFTDADEAKAFVRRKGAPIVVKADGLAAGKGVVVAQTEAEALAAIDDMLSGNTFGDAGSRVVVEQCLTGEEASFIVMVDGDIVVPFASSQDHKARDNGDTGPNTGGMGAYSPAPVVTEAVHRRILDEVIYPTVRGMQAEGNRYRGFLYAGIMIDEEGTPKVLEYNCRFGDPETQPIMMRLQSDLVELCLAATEGRLHGLQTHWDQRPALGVVMAAGGYPGKYRSGDIIHGLDTDPGSDAKVFQAGTASNGSGKTVTSGGRVLCVTALGQTIEDARQRAYDAVSGVGFANSYWRTDIGHRAMNR